MIILAWLAAPLGRALTLTALNGVWIFSAVFALSGAFQSGIGLGGISLLLEIARRKPRTLYRPGEQSAGHSLAFDFGRRRASRLARLSRIILGGSGMLCRGAMGSDCAA